MNDFVIVLGWIGLYAPMALGAVGSIMGCAVAGQAAIGACWILIVAMVAMWVSLQCLLHR